MEPAGNKRPRRNPLSVEEVTNIIAYKKRKEILTLHKLKSGVSYKIQNCFNILCFCVYLEILFCFFGPCNYQLHYTQSALPKYGEQINKKMKPIIADINMICVNGHKFNFIIEDFITMPSKHSKFLTGKDFILQKNLKGVLNESEKTYRIFAASPILFLSVFILIISFVGYIYNLNEKAYSLMALNVLNAVTMLGIILL